MLSPSSKRILSPSKQFSSSPRGNKRNLSGSDRICAAFLRNLRWLLVGILGLGFIMNLSMESTSYEIETYSNPDAPDTRISGLIPNVREEKTIYDDFESSADEEQDYDLQTPLIDYDHIPSTTKTSATTNEISSYKASNAPVIVDGWNRTVQVHLIVDVTGHVEFDPASKLLMAGVERSQFTQLKALTFVRPAIETFEMHPRDPKLPLLFLIDWGSMGRDCHRLQLVLETIRNQSESREEEETEEPYLLLVDSSGSTRQTGCSYLFQGNGEGYAHTNDVNRIRLAKRSIVQNRYYDRTTNSIHVGQVAPNSWDGTPPNYNKPVLQFPLALRESFVMGIQNITSGFPLAPYKDKFRPIDVGYFWKNGDYSHYGFYRREIAKVVKKLHHSSLNKKKGTVMENVVEIAYTDSKDMEAGHVQIKYMEQLVRCKIVVIAQRDEWEDHYRLMESLASGALVLTDSMVAIPEGFIDKVHLVVYDGPKHLKELLRYYLKSSHKQERLQIAAAGYNLAMGRHRCWHRLEEVLFGVPLTNANQPNAPAPPKELTPGH